MKKKKIKHRKKSKHKANKLKHKIHKLKHKTKRKRKTTTNKKIKHISIIGQESSRKYLHELKQEHMPSHLSDNKELDFMLKSIEFNNPGVNYRILEAFKTIDRKIFSKIHPYEDMPIHIAHGQTISQPTTIARMLRLLSLEPEQNVLEIGTNTGYHASLVAWLVSPGNVTTIEIFPDLAHQARINIKKLISELEQKKIKKKIHVEIFTGDALEPYQEIWNKNKKYDRIFYTAAVSPNKRWIIKNLAHRTLKEGGLLLFPIKENYDYGGLELWQKQNNQLILIKRDPGYSFVPIIRQKDIEDVYKKLNR